MAKSRATGALILVELAVDHQEAIKRRFVRSVLRVGVDICEAADAGCGQCRI